MTKSEALIYKYASFEKEADKKKKKKSKKKINSKKPSNKKTYAGSRAFMTAANLGSFGIYRPISQRATMGRAAKGQKGITKNEAKVLKALKGKVDPKGKTCPISRFFTSPAASAAVSGAQYATIGGIGGSPKSALIMGGLGAAYGGALQAGYRAVNARANVGRARVGRKGTLPSDKKVLKALKEAKV